MVKKKLVFDAFESFGKSDCNLITTTHRLIKQLKHYQNTSNDSND